jgi:hypothetical protein
MKNIIALTIILGFVGTAAQAQTKPEAPVPTPPVVSGIPVAPELPAKATQKEHKEKEESKQSDSSKSSSK